MAFEVDTDKKIAIFFEESTYSAYTNEGFPSHKSAWEIHGDSRGKKASVRPRSALARGGSPAARRKAECISEAMLSSSFPTQKIQTMQYCLDFYIA